MTPTLTTLKARVDEADEGSRELDADLHLALTTFEARIAGPGWPDPCDLVVPELPGWKLLPHYTTSVDAALALIEAKLPGCWWDLEREYVYHMGSLLERYVGCLRKSRDS